MITTFTSIRTSQDLKNKIKKVVRDDPTIVSISQFLRECVIKELRIRKIME